MRNPHAGTVVVVTIGCALLLNASSLALPTQEALATGVASYMDQQTATPTNQIGSWAVWADPSQTYGVVLRIWPAEGNRFIDATIYEFSGEWAMWQWTITETYGYEDQSQWRQSYIGQYAMNLARRSTDSVWAWARVTYDGTSGSWQESVQEWFLVSFAAPGRIETMVDAMNAPAPIPAPTTTDPGTPTLAPGPTQPTPGQPAPGTGGSGDPRPNTEEGSGSSCDATCANFCQQKGFRTGIYDTDSGIVCLLGQLSGGVTPNETGCTCAR